MAEQPGDLLDYLKEGEALATEWFRPDGIEKPHEMNLEALATMAALAGILEDAATFRALRDKVLIYMVAAFQMGRASRPGQGID